MRDFMKKYQKRKIIWNAWIVLASLVLAFWINIFIIDWTDIWDWLKASVLESETENKADLFIENNNGEIVIKNSKEIIWVESLSLSLGYDSENLEITWISSKLWEVVELWENNTWMDTLIIQINWSDIKKNSEVLNIDASKIEDSSEQINLINVNFKDSSSEQYNLSTSWITF